MALQVNTLNPLYRYDGIDLPVPSHIAHDQAALKAFHAEIYPAILTADLVDVGPKGENYVYEYRRAVGTKG